MVCATSGAIRLYTNQNSCPIFNFCVLNTANPPIPAPPRAENLKLDDKSNKIIGIFLMQLLNIASIIKQFVENRNTYTSSIIFVVIKE